MKEDHSAVFYRRLDRDLPLAVKASGVWIEDSQGNRYLDASGGAIVVNVGHGRKEISEAVMEQIETLGYVHGTMFTSKAVEELAGALAKHAPKGIDRFYFLTSGSEAIEAAIKLARQIHLETGHPQRTVLIARWKSYHGLSLGALAATGRTAFRTPFVPMITDAVHIPPPYCLRCSLGLTYPGCKLRCAWLLEETIQCLGPEVVSAFIAETVSGATLAACLPPPGYWKAIREICDKYGVLLIMDEVMCGMGRTGTWFACEQYDVVPDIITLGKGIAGGTQPLSAVGTSFRFVELLKRSKGGFVHGGTYSHHSVACAAGLAVVRIMEREGLVERCAKMGLYLGELLRAKLMGLRHVGDVRGVGLMWGIEIVKDKATLAPFSRSERVAERIWEALFKKGIITYRSVGLAGIDGDAIMLGPPFVIEEAQLEMAVDALAEVITSTLE